MTLWSDYSGIQLTETGKCILIVSEKCIEPYSP